MSDHVLPAKVMPHDEGELPEYLKMMVETQGKPAFADLAMHNDQESSMGDNSKRNISFDFTKEYKFVEENLQLTDRTFTNYQVEQNGKGSSSSLTVLPSVKPPVEKNDSLSLMKSIVDQQLEEIKQIPFVAVTSEKTHVMPQTNLAKSLSLTIHPTTDQSETDFIFEVKDQAQRLHSLKKSPELIPIEQISYCPNPAMGLEDLTNKVKYNQVVALHHGYNTTLSEIIEEPSEGLIDTKSSDTMRNRQLINHLIYDIADPEVVSEYSKNLIHTGQVSPSNLPGTQNVLNPRNNIFSLRTIAASSPNLAEEAAQSTAPHLDLSPQWDLAFKPDQFQRSKIEEANAMIPISHFTKKLYTSSTPSSPQHQNIHLFTPGDKSNPKGALDFDKGADKRVREQDEIRLPVMKACSDTLTDERQQDVIPKTVPRPVTNRPEIEIRDEHLFKRYSEMVSCPLAESKDTLKLPGDKETGDDILGKPYNSVRSQPSENLLYQSLDPSLHHGTLTPIVPEAKYSKSTRLKPFKSILGPSPKEGYVAEMLRHRMVGSNTVKPSFFTSNAIRRASESNQNDDSKLTDSIQISRKMISNSQIFTNFKKKSRDKSERREKTQAEKVGSERGPRYSHYEPFLTNPNSGNKAFSSNAKPKIRESQPRPIVEKDSSITRNVNDNIRKMIQDNLDISRSFDVDKEYKQQRANICNHLQRINHMLNQIGEVFPKKIDTSLINKRNERLQEMKLLKNQRYILNVDNCINKTRESISTCKEQFLDDFLSSTDNVMANTSTSFFSKKALLNAASSGAKRQAKSRSFKKGILNPKAPNQSTISNIKTTFPKAHVICKKMKKSVIEPAAKSVDLASKAKSKGSNKNPQFTVLDEGSHNSTDSNLKSQQMIMTLSSLTSYPVNIQFKPSIHTTNVVPQPFKAAPFKLLKSLQKFKEIEGYEALKSKYGRGSQKHRKVRAAFGLYPKSSLDHEMFKGSHRNIFRRETG